MTEFIIFGSKPQLDKCKTKTLNVNDTEIEHADKIKIPGCHIRPKAQLKTAYNFQMSNSNAEHPMNQKHQTSINPGGNRDFGPMNSNVTFRLL